jgi:hypothetical protein
MFPRRPAGTGASGASVEAIRVITWSNAKSASRFEAVAWRSHQNTQKEMEKQPLWQKTTPALFTAAGPTYLIN